MVFTAKSYGKTSQTMHLNIKTYGFEARVHTIKATGRPRASSKGVDIRVINISDKNPTMSARKIQSQPLFEAIQAPSVEEFVRNCYDE